MKMKHKGLKTALAGLLAVGGAVSLSQAAYAYTDVAINDLQSPNNYGHFSGTLSWLASDDVQDYGTVYDTAADGHGPYFHAIAAQDDGSNYQFDSDHLTAGKGYSSNTSGEDHYFGAGGIEWVDVWMCNGGSISGYGVEGGCYGRRYWNQITYPGRGSSSLGSTTGAVY